MINIFSYLTGKSFAKSLLSATNVSLYFKFISKYPLLFLNFKANWSFIPSIFSVLTFLPTFSRNLSFPNSVVIGK